MRDPMRKHRDALVAALREIEQWGMDWWAHGREPVFEGHTGHPAFVARARAALRAVQEERCLECDGWTLHSALCSRMERP